MGESGGGTDAAEGAGQRGRWGHARWVLVTQGRCLPVQPGTEIIGQRGWGDCNPMKIWGYIIPKQRNFHSLDSCGSLVPLVLFLLPSICLCSFHSRLAVEAAWLMATQTPHRMDYSWERKLSRTGPCTGSMEALGNSFHPSPDRDSWMSSLVGWREMGP